MKPSVSVGVDSDTGQEFRIVRDELGREWLSHRADSWATWSAPVRMDLELGEEVV